MGLTSQWTLNIFAWISAPKTFMLEKNVEETKSLNVLQAKILYHMPWKLFVSKVISHAIWRLLFTSMELKVGYFLHTSSQVVTEMHQTVCWFMDQITSNKVHMQQMRKINKNEINKIENRKCIKGWLNVGCNGQLMCMAAGRNLAIWTGPEVHF